MLDRYDDRLSEFAQTLNDAVNQTLPARILAAIAGAPSARRPPARSPDHANVMRLLEVAREHTSADAAVAIVADRAGADPRHGRPLGGRGGPGRPARRAGLPRRARDPGLVQRRRRHAARRDPIRYGLAVPLLDSPHEPGMLAVLTRTPDRRFSDLDITSLENVLASPGRRSKVARAARAGSGPGPRPAHRALRPAGVPCAPRPRDRTRARTARAARAPHARRRPADDAQRAASAISPRTACSRRSRGVLNDVPARTTCRAGSAAAASASSSAGRQPRRRAALRAGADRPARAAAPEAGVISISGGVAELLPFDDATALHRARRRRARAREGLRPGHGRHRRETEELADVACSSATPPARPMPASGLGLVQREERRVCGQRDDAELGQAVALADELARRGLLHPDRPGSVGVGAALGPKLARDRGPGESGGAARRGRSGRRRALTVNMPSAVRIVARASRRYSEDGLGGRRRQRDAAAFRKPARRR